MGDRCSLVFTYHQVCRHLVMLMRCSKRPANAEGDDWQDPVNSCDDDCRHAVWKAADADGRCTWCLIDPALPLTRSRRIDYVFTVAPGMTPEDIDFVREWQPFTARNQPNLRNLAGVLQESDDDYCANWIRSVRLLVAAHGEQTAMKIIAAKWDNVIFLFRTSEQPGLDAFSRVYFMGHQSDEKLLEPVTDRAILEAEESCSICQESALGSETVVKLPCGHMYHEGCIREWISDRKTCPNCRKLYKVMTYDEFVQNGGNLDFLTLL